MIAITLVIDSGFKVVICIPKDKHSDIQNLEHLKKVYKNSEKFKYGKVTLFDIAKNNCSDFKKFESYYAFVQSGYYGPEINIGNEKRRENFYPSQSIIDFKQNDCVYVCIEYIFENDEYYLYFVNGKNDATIGSSLCSKELGLNYGKIRLDFENYDYLYALSSIKCDCDKKQNVKGFEYQVSFA